MPRIATIQSLESRRLLASVALFYDPAFVDTSSAGAAAEARNLKAQLEATGHTVKTFTGTASTSWSAALSGTDLLLLPELEKGDLNTVLSNAARDVVRSYLSAGGGLINVGDHSGRNVAVLNSLLGTTMSTNWPGSRSGDLDAAGAAGTAFAGGPATLPSLADTDYLRESGQPAGSRFVYRYRYNTASSYQSDYVALLSYAGRLPVAWLAWDFNNGGPNGTQDGGWNDVLARSIRQVARPAPVAPAAPTALTAVASSSSQVNLAWTDNATNETGFKIERATTSAGPWTQIGTTAANVKTFAATGLTANTTYVFRVRANNGATNSGYSNLATAMTLASAAPFATLTAGILTVNGTSGNDRIGLTVGGATLTAKLNALPGLTFSNSAVTSIRVLAGAGNDTVTIGAGVRGTRVEAGDGNDTVLGGNNSDTLLGQNGNDFLVGGLGADSIDGGAGDDWLVALDGVKDTLIGGTGTDSAQVDPTDAASLLELIA